MYHLQLSISEINGTCDPRVGADEKRWYGLHATHFACSHQVYTVTLQCCILNDYDQLPSVQTLKNWKYILTT